MFGMSWWDWDFTHRLLKSLCYHMMWLKQDQHPAQLQKRGERDQLDLLQDSAGTSGNPSFWWGWWRVSHLENSFVKMIWESWWTVEPASETCLCGKGQQPSGKVLPVLREAFLLLYSVLVGQFWTDGSSHALPRAKDTRPYWSELRKVPQRWLKGWSHPIMKKNWDSCDCSALRRLRGNLTSMYKYFLRGNAEDGARIFLVVFRTRGNRQNWNTVNSTSTQENTFFYHEGS